MSFKQLSALLLLLPSVLGGGIYESIDNLPTDVKFDFLIVGGQFVSSFLKDIRAHFYANCQVEPLAPYWQKG
jgi:hypothetical protein